MDCRWSAGRSARGGDLGTLDGGHHPSSDELAEKIASIHLLLFETTVRLSLARTEGFN